MIDGGLMDRLNLGDLNTHYWISEAIPCLIFTVCTSKYSCTILRISWDFVVHIQAVNSNGVDAVDISIVSTGISV